MAEEIPTVEIPTPEGPTEVPTVKIMHMHQETFKVWTEPYWRVKPDGTGKLLYPICFEGSLKSVQAHLKRLRKYETVKKGTMSQRQIDEERARMELYEGILTRHVD